MDENIPKTAEEFDRRFDEGEDIFSLGMKAAEEKPEALSIKFNPSFAAQGTIIPKSDG